MKIGGIKQGFFACTLKTEEPLIKGHLKFGSFLSCFCTGGTKPGNGIL